MTRRTFEVHLSTTVEANSPQEAVHRAIQLTQSDSLHKFRASTAQGAQSLKPVVGLEDWVKAQRDEWLGIWHFGSEPEVSSTGLDPHLPTPDAVKWIGDTYSTKDLPQELPNVQDAS